MRLSKHQQSLLFSELKTRKQEYKHLLGIKAFAQCIELTILANYVHVFILDLLSLSRCIRVLCNIIVQKFTHLFKLWFLVSLVAQHNSSAVLGVITTQWLPYSRVLTQSSVIVWLDSINIWLNQGPSIFLLIKEDRTASAQRTSITQLTHLLQHSQWFVSLTFFLFNNR